MFWQLDNIVESDPVIYDDTEQRKFTYGELKKLGCSFSKSVESLQKQLAFVYCENSFRCILAYLSLLRAGHAVFLTDSEIDPVLGKKLLQTYRPDFIWHPHSKEDGFPEFEKISLEYENHIFYRKKRNERSPIHPDLAILLSTSGTTGSPKLVRLSYQNIQSNAQSIVSYLKIAKEEKAITTLPLHYSFGLSILHSYLAAGAQIICTKKSVVEKGFWPLFKEQSCTSLSGVPYTYQILKRLRFHRMNLPSLKNMTQAGGRLDPEDIQYFLEIAQSKNIQFFVMYGQTEAAPRISYVPDNRLQEKIGSIGIPVPNGTMKLVQQGIEIFGSDKEGELVFQGANVMMGYAQEKADLSKGDEQNGILHTGDLAIRDKDSFYWITGRLKRIIKIYGLRINLDEIEQMLESKLGKPVACLGKDDILSIVIESNETQTAQQALQHVIELYHLHRSVLYAYCDSTLPFTPSGKKNYQEIQSRIVNGLL
ncbi:MAG: AMP-binding protein [SAR324 cluster bacterium]|nr:AMP-binding protein [SAR324 cluster bacterium]